MENHNLKRYSRLAISFFILLGALYISSCKRDSPEIGPAALASLTPGPVIDTILPNTVTNSGDTINIRGKYLKDIISIMFDSTQIDSDLIFIEEDSVIRVIVPNNVDPGKVVVTVEATLGEATSTFNIYKEYMIMGFENGPDDKVSNASIWSYRDSIEDWAFVLPAITDPYAGSNYLHMDGIDDPVKGNYGWWIGGCGHGAGNSDPVFGLPNANPAETYLNIYVRTDGMTSLSASLRQTDGEALEGAFVPTQAGVWELVSVKLSDFICGSAGCVGDGEFNVELINGFSLNLITLGTNYHATSVDVDNMIITVGGPLIE